MDEMIFDKIPGLDKLLNTKDFNELSTSEKEAVLKWMSMEEYESLSNAIRSASSIFKAESEGILPDPKIKQQLMDRMGLLKPAHKKKSLVNHFFSYRIPVYQVAIAALFIICLAIYFGKTVNHKNLATQYISKLDTVFIEKMVSSSEQTLSYQAPTHSHKFGSIQSPEINKTSGRSSMKKAYSNRIASQVENVEQLISLGMKAKPGRTALDDSLLIKMMVSVN